MQMVFMETYETYGGYRVADSQTATALIVERDIETAIRAELCVGPYVDGKTQRVVHVMINGEHWGKYSATRIRKFQSH